MAHSIRGSGADSRSEIVQYVIVKREFILTTNVHGPIWPYLFFIVDTI